MVDSNTGELVIDLDDVARREEIRSPFDMDAAHMELGVWQKELSMMPREAAEEAMLCALLERKIHSLEDKIIAAGGRLSQQATSFLEKFDQSFQASQDSANKSIAMMNTACQCCGIVMKPGAVVPSTCMYQNQVRKSSSVSSASFSSVSLTQPLPARVPPHDQDANAAIVDEVFEL